jgi:hypothetical protein
MDYYRYGKDKHVVETSHCSQKRPSRVLTQTVHLTPSLTIRAALQLRNGPFAGLCREATGSTQVVTRSNTCNMLRSASKESGQPRGRVA